MIVRAAERTTDAERRFRAEAAAILRQLDRLEAGSVRAVAVQVRMLRRDLLTMLSAVPSGSWTAFHLPALLSQVDVALSSWAAASSGIIGGGLNEAWGLGEELTREFAMAAGAPRGVLLVDRSAVGALRVATAEQVRRVADDVKLAISREVRAAALGVQRPAEAIHRVAQRVPGIRQPVYDAANRRIIRRRYVGPSARAETIVRTELNRTFNYAGKQRLDDLAETIPEMRQQWVAARDHRTRTTHRAAHGQARAKGELFSVGTARLRQPGDIAGPAREVINCRCVLIGKMPEWEGAPSLPDDGT